jgi:REP element-mobilizing transposase RayT
MSRKYKFWDSDKMYFISFATVHWIDVFIRNQYRDILLQSWQYCQKEKGLEIYGWCIMPSHVHMIISSHGNRLEEIVRDMKAFTSNKLRAAIAGHPQESRREWMAWMMERAGKKNANNNGWQFWQQHNQPLEIAGREKHAEVLEYMHQNPVAAGFVHLATDWVYSSARGYEKNNGQIKLAELE